MGRLSSAELSEWMAFYELEPWGAEIENARAGTIAAMIFNMAPKKKATQPRQWFHFFKSTYQNYRQSWREQLEIARRVFPRKNKTRRG